MNGLVSNFDGNEGATGMLLPLLLLLLASGFTGTWGLRIELVSLVVLDLGGGFGLLGLSSLAG